MCRDMVDPLKALVTVDVGDGRRATVPKLPDDADRTRITDQSPVLTRRHGAALDLK
jgi:hypothetical protein